MGDRHDCQAHTLSPQSSDPPLPFLLLSFLCSTPKTMTEDVMCCRITNTSLMSFWIDYRTVFLPLARHWIFEGLHRVSELKTFQPSSVQLIIHSATIFGNFSLTHHQFQLNFLFSLWRPKWSLPSSWKPFKLSPRSLNARLPNAP